MGSLSRQYRDTEPDEGLPVATVQTRYEFDCPECGDVVDLGDVDESGSVVECGSCNARVNLTQP